MSLLGFCEWLEQTSLSAAIRESAWAFPIIESVHVLALCLFGLLILIDLRVLGLALTRVPAPEVAEDLTPWMTLGLVVVIVSAPTRSRYNANDFEKELAIKHGTPASAKARTAYASASKLSPKP